MSDNKLSSTVPLPSAPVPVGQAPIPASMADLAKQLLDLQKQVNEKATKAEVVTKAMVTPPVKPEIDWANMDENSVFDMSIPIPAIEQEVPDYLNMHVQDKMYVTRWIHKLRERLGPCLAAGYTYVTKPEIDNRYPISLEPDSEGHYTFGDVVLLKILKSRYFPALRRNHEKSMSIHGARQVKGKIGSETSNNPKLESAIRRGAISFYEQEATEESGPDLEAVTL
jgi:hypothetical protein